jgi:hypothetical protein
VQRLLLIRFDKAFLSLLEHHPGPVFGIAGARQRRAAFEVFARFHIIFRAVHAAGVDQPQQHLGVYRRIAFAIPGGILQQRDGVRRRWDRPDG